MAQPESKGEGYDLSHTVDLAAVRRVLSLAEDGRQERPPFRLVLRNEALLLSLHLTIDPLERSLSLYLRGDNGFLGFLHLGSVHRVEVDEAQRQVFFVIVHEAGESTLKIEQGGVFALAQRKTTTGTSPSESGGEPDHA